MAKLGRPTKYDPKMCDVVLEQMAVGASIEEVCAELGIWKDTLYNWTKDEDKGDFSDAISYGKQLSKAWWHKEGRLNLKEKDFSPQLWYMNMKNRFGWADRTETKHSGLQPPQLVIGISTKDEERALINVTQQARTSIPKSSD